MRTMTLTLSETEFNQLGNKSGEISFADLRRQFLAEVFRDRQTKLANLVEESGMGEMTMEEITEIVKDVRREAKGNH